MGAMRWYHLTTTSLVSDGRRPRLCPIERSLALEIARQPGNLPMLSLSRRVAFALAGVGVTAVAGLAFARRALVDPDHEASLRQRLFVAFGDSRLAGIRLVGQEREAQQGGQTTLAQKRAVA